MLVLFITKERININFFLQVSQDMGIDAPVPISAKLGDFNNIFCRIVSSAERPHLSIPETEVGRSRKQYHRLVKSSVTFVSGISNP